LKLRWLPSINSSAARGQCDAHGHADTRFRCRSVGDVTLITVDDFDFSIMCRWIIRGRSCFLQSRVRAKFSSGYFESIFRFLEQT